MCDCHQAGNSTLFVNFEHNPQGPSSPALMLVDAACCEGAEESVLVTPLRFSASGVATGTFCSAALQFQVAL